MNQNENYQKLERKQIDTENISYELSVTKDKYDRVSIILSSAKKTKDGSLFYKGNVKIVPDEKIITTLSRELISLLPKYRELTKKETKTQNTTTPTTDTPSLESVLKELVTSITQIGQNQQKITSRLSKIEHKK